MKRVFIHVTGQGTHANQIDIEEAAKLLADARRGENVVNNNDYKRAKLDVEYIDSGTVFQLGGCPMEETCPTLIVMDIY